VGVAWFRFGIVGVGAGCSGASDEGWSVAMAMLSADQAALPYLTPNPAMARSAKALIGPQYNPNTSVGPASKVL